MNKLLLNMLALSLLPIGVAVAQKPAASPSPQKAPIATPVADVKPGTPFALTELQKARMDAARQEAARWQDKLSEAVQRFSALCAEAQKENNWPAVQCSLNDLSVAAVPPPLKPADK